MRGGAWGAAALLGAGAGWAARAAAGEGIGLAAAGLVIAAAAFGRLRTDSSAVFATDVMRPSFVPVFTALLLAGPAAPAVAVAAVLAARLTSSAPGRSRMSRLAHVAADVVAAYSAASVWTWALGIPALAPWPARGAAVGASAAVYVLVRGAGVHLVAPLLARAPIDRHWLAWPLAGVAVHVTGAGVAAGLAAIVDRGAWQIAPAAAAGLLCAYAAYAGHLRGLDEERRRRDVVHALDHGMAACDAEGRITFWDSALERMTGVSRRSAAGEPLVLALPALSRTELPRILTAVLMDGRERSLPEVRVGSAPDVRTFEVRILPTADGAALLWQDVTDRTRTEADLRRTGDRLALAAEGANDGLWQWDLRTKEFYVSSRWRAMVGLSPRDGAGTPDEWFERVHPDDRADLERALESHLSGQTEIFHHEHRLRHEDGTYRRFLCRGLGVRGLRGRRDRIAGSLTDTTEQALAQERLRSVGFLDPLTGLFNRVVFVEGLGRRLEELRHRQVPTAFAVLYLDLDRFKIVNDSLGHLVGDELLIAVSRRLETCVRPGDALARLGGDEFAILLNGLGDDAQANAIAFRIQDALSAPFSIGGREVFTTASIGIAFGPAHYTNPDEIMRDADTAMYHAKSRGKARHEVFDADMHARVRDRLSLENDLRRAVVASDFDVHYQPIVSLTSGMCVGFESLVRWSRNGEPISPATFIPIAEELGLIEPLGTWVLQQACQTFAEWQRRFPGAGLDCITVNVSSRQLVQHNFVRVVQRAVRSAGLRPADLRIEITETALMDSPGEAAGVLRELRDFGVKVYLDDFGTGYSSLSHLHKLPVDALKIDSSFVRSLLLPDRPAIVESILALARTLNTSVVAEGIESAVQARELERLGCTHAQGFLFSRPLSTQSVEQLVMANQPLGPKGALVSLV